ncbi:Serine/threonine-protein kinase, active site [Sesbania bispinosa]|nr:Serine/threonine-protein kinase, active site [Sesbania bispinosa]
MSKLLKLSLRNCNLRGPIPDLSRIPHLLYLDLSSNQLNESIPSNKLSENITTIILSNNNLTGTISSSFSGLPRLQKLSLANNSLTGGVPSTIWQSKTSNEKERLLLELENNKFTTISGSTNLPPNVTLLSEVQRIISLFTEWTFPSDDLFGPYELIDLTLLDPYKDVIDTSSKASIGMAAMVGIILGSIACVMTLSAIVILFMLRKQLRGSHGVSKPRHELSSATNNFDSSAQVGRGGYGKVYKGVISDGTVVAIKRAQHGSLQGEKEFLTEISILSRLHHRNLVTLIGYCDEEGEQMLVYEFISNGTLKDHLSDTSEKPLTFAMRLKIALGTTKGLTYLHTEADPPIFHRDVKANNILLDNEFNAKVADFGLSKLAPVPDIEGIVPGHVSTLVKGTPGYLDPEYFLTHKLTDKSDVYSLGVVFLELLTGMQPISHGKNIVREVTDAYHSALKCCQDEPEARPKMEQVVRVLENICSMMPDSDTMRVEYITNDSGRGAIGTPSSSSVVRTPFVSADVSGSNLVSGVIPSINPR